MTKVVMKKESTTSDCEHDPLKDQSRDEKESTSSDCEHNPLKLLFDLVISPVANLIHGNDIIIVPDGPLFLAPFAAFVDQNSRYLSGKVHHSSCSNINQSKDDD